MDNRKRTYRESSKKRRERLKSQGITKVEAYISNDVKDIILSVKNYHNYSTFSEALSHIVINFRGLASETSKLN